MGRRFAAFEGGAEFARKLAELDENLGGALLMEAAIAGAEPIRDTAATLAPRATGDLSENIDTEVATAQPRKAVVHIGPNKEKAWHGIFPELGTANQAAQPYLRPAFDEKRGEAVDRFAKKLKTGIAGVTGGAP